MNYYITTTLPYVNADPHVGFALEVIKADAWARWRRANGQEVFFNTGSDEHGLKISRQALAAGLSPQEFCDRQAAKFQKLRQVLNLSYDHFTRTTDPEHVAAAREFWRRCLAAGDIYKKQYRVKYCVGCELEKTDSELTDGHCPLHPAQELEFLDEENYFFRFSRYQEPLLALYRERPDFVLPTNRLKEIRNFVAAGLTDFSISRLKNKMPWGVAVPDDPEQVMYVWFDALVNYISCLGWPDNLENFEKFWPGWQICGKDNLRQQSAMWQAMLMSAGLESSRQVIINGFMTANGQKMSKSLGNVVNPLTLAERSGTDAVRYYLLSQTNPFEDSDFNEEHFAAVYTADLANGLGNLAARVASLAEKNQLKFAWPAASPEPQLATAVNDSMEHWLLNEALAIIWERLRQADVDLSRRQPWKMNDAALIKDALEPTVALLRQTAKLLEPFLPETAVKLQTQFCQEQIVKGEALFPRSQ